MASNYYFGGCIRVSRGTLTAFAWSAPMRDLANRVGVSDVGLRKLLTGHGIVLPPQGHWNRVHAGRSVPEPPSPLGRRPGERQLLNLDARFGSVLACEPPADPDGPFASGMVPEDLDALRVATARKVGRVAQRTSLSPLHPGLSAITIRDERRREKAAREVQPWAVARPLFDGALDQRRLRLLNTLFWVLRKQNVDADAHTRHGEIQAQATVGATPVTITLQPLGRAPQTQRWTPAVRSRELPAATPLVLEIGSGFGGVPTTSWSDEKAGAIETQLAKIVVEIVVTGEAAYRRSLREELNRLEAAVRARDERRRARLVQLDEERLASLRRSGDLLRQAQELRALIASVETAVREGSHEMSERELGAWSAWARGVADGIDPVMSGQVVEHLRPRSAD